MVSSFWWKMPAARPASMPLWWNSVQHFQIKAIAHAVGVDAVQADLPGTVVHAPADPVQRIPAGVLAAALGEYPELAVHPFDIRREHHALVAVAPGRRRDQVTRSKSSSVLMPPPTVSGMNTSLATRVRMSVKRARPSKLAVMS